MTKILAYILQMLTIVETIFHKLLEKKQRRYARLMKLDIKNHLTVFNLISSFSKRSSDIANSSRCKGKQVKLMENFHSSFLNNINSPPPSMNFK